MWFRCLQTSSRVRHHLRSSFMTLNAFLMCRGLRVMGPCLSDPSSFSSACGQSLVHLRGTAVKEECPEESISPVHAGQQAAHFRVYPSFVHISHRNKVFVQKEEQTARAGPSAGLNIRLISINVLGNILHTHTFAYTATTLAHYHWQEEHVRRLMCLLTMPTLSCAFTVTQSKLFIQIYVKLLRDNKWNQAVWHVNVKSFVLLLSFN